MGYQMDETGAARVAGYFNGVIGQHMPRRDQRASFATYARADYAVAIKTNTVVWLLDAQGRRRGVRYP